MQIAMPRSLVFLGLLLLVCVAASLGDPIVGGRRKLAADSMSQCSFYPDGSCDFNLAAIAALPPPTTPGAKLLVRMAAIRAQCRKNSNVKTCNADPSHVCTWLELDGKCDIEDMFDSILALLSCPDSEAQILRECLPRIGGKSTCESLKGCQYIIHNGEDFCVTPKFTTESADDKKAEVAGVFDNYSEKWWGQCPGSKIAAQILSSKCTSLTSEDECDATDDCIWVSEDYGDYVSESCSLTNTAVISMLVGDVTEPFNAQYLQLAKECWDIISPFECISWNDLTVNAQVSATLLDTYDTFDINKELPALPPSSPPPPSPPTPPSPSPLPPGILAPPTSPPSPLPPNPSSPPPSPRKQAIRPPPPPPVEVPSIAEDASEPWGMTPTPDTIPAPSEDDSEGESSGTTILVVMLTILAVAILVGGGAFFAFKYLKTKRSFREPRPPREMQLDYETLGEKENLI